MDILVGIEEGADLLDFVEVSQFLEEESYIQRILRDQP